MNASRLSPEVLGAIEFERQGVDPYAFVWMFWQKKIVLRRHTAGLSFSSRGKSQSFRFADIESFFLQVVDKFIPIQVFQPYFGREYIWTFEPNPSLNVRPISIKFFIPPATRRGPLGIPFNKSDVVSDPDCEELYRKLASLIPKNKREEVVLNIHG